MELPAKLSKLSRELREDFLDLGKELGIDVTVDTPLKFFNTEKIKSKALKERAEKLLKKAESEVLSLATLRHHTVASDPAQRHKEAPEEMRRPFRKGEKEELSPVDKITGMETISVGESKQLLSYRNSFFASRLQEEKIDLLPIAKYGTIILACSDARCDPTQFGDFKDNSVLMIQLAGNVASDDVKRALARLEYKGSVIVCGHEDCGACKAKAKAQSSKGAEKPTGAIGHLLGEVNLDKKGPFATNAFTANAINQANALAGSPAIKEAIAKNHATVIPVSMDFENESRPLKPLIRRDIEEKVEILPGLEVSASVNISNAKKEGKPITSIQYAHAIIVSDPIDLGKFSNPRTVFNSGLNELFCVSALEGKVSKEAIASVEYALEHIRGVKENNHIVIVHSDKKVLEVIKIALLKGSALIKELTESGKTMTLMQFDKRTGETELVS